MSGQLNFKKTMIVFLTLFIIGCILLTIGMVVKVSVTEGEWSSLSVSVSQLAKGSNIFVLMTNLNSLKSLGDSAALDKIIALDSVAISGFAIIMASILFSIITFLRSNKEVIFNR